MRKNPNNVGRSIESQLREVLAQTNRQAQDKTGQTYDRRLTDYKLILYLMDFITGSARSMSGSVSATERSMNERDGTNERRDRCGEKRSQ